MSTLRLVHCLSLLCSKHLLIFAYPSTLIIFLIYHDVTWRFDQRPIRRVHVHVVSISTLTASFTITHPTIQPKTKMPPKSKAKIKKPASVPSTTQPPPTQRPNWPALTPLSPPTDLTITTLLPAQILTIPHLFTPTLSTKYVSFLRSLPLVTTPATPKRGNAVRVNDRYQLDDPTFARNLWHQTALHHLITTAKIDNDELLTTQQKLSLFGGKVLGLNPNIRVYRYSAGQFFDRHVDESNDIMFEMDDGAVVAAKTTWTLLLYLTACEGGETVFYPDAPSRKAVAPAPVEASPQVGLALLHRHGNECMVHEGREVLGGEKWIIRSDLCVRR
jgi:hypothetical protein